MDDGYEPWQDDVPFAASFVDLNDQNSPLDPLISAEEPSFGDVQVPEPATGDTFQNLTDLYFDHIRNSTEMDLRSMFELDANFLSDIIGIMSDNDGSLCSLDPLSPSTTSEWDNRCSPTTMPANYVCPKALDIGNSHPSDPVIMSGSSIEVSQNPVLTQVNVSGLSPSSTNNNEANIIPRVSS